MNGNKVFRIINKNDSIDLLFQLDEKEVISAIDYDGINKIWVGTTTGMGYYDIKEKRYFKIRSQLFNDITASVMSLLQKGYGSVHKTNYFLTA